MQKLIPLRSLGQNFLIDKNIIKKVIDAAEIKKNETVVEIGPGKGALTFELAKRAKKVIAIEKDKGLADELQNKIKDNDIGNVEIVHGDAMKMDKTPSIPLSEGGGVKVVSNPPYDIASRLLIDFLASENPPKKIVFVIQKEVAKKATVGAQRSVPLLSSKVLFSVLIQAFGKPKIISKISRNCFFPKPRVDSAILVVDPFEDVDFNKNEFIRVTKAGFSSRRKFLISNLSGKLKISKENLQKIFSELKLDEKIRAEELTAEDWINLTKKLI